MTSDRTAAPGGHSVVPGSGETANTQPAARSDVPAELDDRTQLTTLLDYARATVHAKCAGISEHDARRAPLPTSPLMTISGLVSHLRWVHLQTTNPIESTFATVRHRTKVTKGPGSRAAGAGHGVQAHPVSARPLAGRERTPPRCAGQGAGAHFERGVLAERPEATAA